MSRQEYLWQQKANPETLTDIQRAARFFYLQKLAFGAKVVGQSFGTATTAPPRLNLLRLEEDLSDAHLRLSRVTIERLDWQECIRRYDRPGTLFYLDPPYWGTSGYGVDFGLEQYEQMAKIALEAKGQVVISVNDIPEMRYVFSEFNLTAVNLQYTVGGYKQRGIENRELIITQK